VHDRTFSNPQIQGGGLSTPGSWHQPACPLPGAAVPYPPGDIPAAETVPSRDTAVAVRGASLCFAQNLKLSIAGWLFSPFTLNYSVVQVSKIKDF